MPEKPQSWRLALATKVVATGRHRRAVLDEKLKEVAAQEAIKRMGKRVDKADKSVVGASTKKRKRQKTSRLNVGLVPKRGKGHQSY